MMGGFPSFDSIKQGLMGSSPSYSATASPSNYTSFGAGGGMDVMGTLKQHAGMGSRYAGGNAMAGPMSGPFGMAGFGGF